MRVCTYMQITRQHDVMVSIWMDVSLCWSLKFPQSVPYRETYSTHRNTKIRLYTISKMWFKENHVRRILKFYRLETQSQVWSYAHHILSAYPCRIWVDCRMCGSISSYTPRKCRYHIYTAELQICGMRMSWGAEQHTFYTSVKTEGYRSNSTRRFGLGSVYTLSQYHSNHNLTVLYNPYNHPMPTPKW